MSKNKHKEQISEESNTSEIESGVDTENVDTQNIEAENTEEESRTAEELVSIKKEEWDSLCYKLAKLNTDYYELEKDFDNFRQKSKENVYQSRIDGMKDALSSILPALDSINKAKSMMSETSSLQGLELIEKSILSALEKLKVERIKAVGERFDPTLHNAVFMQEKEGVEAGVVIDELESGYTYDGKVLKYSSVVVAK